MFWCAWSKQVIKKKSTFRASSCPLRHLRRRGLLTQVSSWNQVKAKVNESRRNSRSLEYNLFSRIIIIITYEPHQLVYLSTYRSGIPRFVQCQFSVLPHGGAEIARPDIARPDKSAPYRKVGHRETWQLGTISQGWTSRELTTRHHISQIATSWTSVGPRKIERAER